MEQSQTPAHTTEQDQQASDTSELKASVRPSVSALLPTSSEPETPAQRHGDHRNGAYKEKVAVKRVDPQAAEQAEEARRRVVITLGLEVALAMALTLASRLWAWAQEERARARVDRALRRRNPAT